MDKLELFYFLVGTALILWGVSVFVSERVLIVIAGIVAIAAGVISLMIGLE